MDDSAHVLQGEALAARVRAELERLGLTGLTVCYFPKHNVVRLSWPHLNAPAAEEGVEFPASAEWTARIELFLRTFAKDRKPTTRAKGQ
jgi:hypothetical protein